MEDLNKQQLILLTLLVSFVTSIATGIITFTLLQQAPVEVTQTINRVVERTIEKVVPAEGEGEGTVREVTTVVSEEDLILESIDKNVNSIVRLKTLGADGSEIVTGLGLVVSADGVVATDESSFGSGNYSIMFHDNVSYNVSKSFRDVASGIVFLKVGKPIGDAYRFYPAVLGNSDILKLGQTLIAVGGRERNTVGIGRITDLERSNANTVGQIATDITIARSESGSPILNLNGEVVGIESKPLNNAESTSYKPVSSLQNVLKAALAELAK